MGDEQLGGEGDLVEIGDERQDDRLVARDPVSPESGLALGVLGEDISVGAEGGAGVEDVRGQPLEQVGVLRRPVAVPVFDLCVGPGQLEGAGDGGGLAVVVGQGERFLSGVGQGGDEGDDACLAGLDPDPPSEAEHRVEHGPGRPRKGHPRVHRGGVGGRAPSAEEPGAVGLELGGRRGRAVARRDVDGVDRHLLGRPRAAPADQGLGAGGPLGLQEQLAEGRMAHVAAVGQEHDLGVAGQLQLARAGVVVGQRDPADLGAGLRRDGDLGDGLDRRVEPAKGHLVGREDRLVVLGREAGGLVAGRPEGVGADVLDIDEQAAGVAGAVLAPAGDVQTPAGAVSRPGVGEHHAVLGVRQQVGARERRGGRAQTPAHQRDAGAFHL